MHEACELRLSFRLQRYSKPTLLYESRNCLMLEGIPDPAVAILLISHDSVWHDATAAAASQLGLSRVAIVADPAAALNHLIAAGDSYTHVLVDTSLTDEWLELFTGMTVGEAGARRALIRLGPNGRNVRSVPAVRYPDAARLVETLTTPHARSPHLPTLTSAELAAALQGGQITCRFQPIVRISDRRPIGLEVLARLNHPTRGALPPSMFIPQMEQLGYSLNLTDAVFQSCLSLIGAEFLEAHELFISLNLPLDALLLPESLSLIEARRSNAGVPAGRVLIELTESRPVHDIPSLTLTLERWRALGYRLAIDDIGPDVVNQVGLLDMPFHTVKLDKQIVLRSRNDALARRYLQRTVTLARSRSIEIIAEGIEDQLMWDRMAEMGVDHAQGFMISRALPAAALPAWLAYWNQSLPPIAPGREPHNQPV